MAYVFQWLQYYVGETLRKARVYTQLAWEYVTDVAVKSQRTVDSKYAYCVVYILYHFTYKKFCERK